MTEQRSFFLIAGEASGDLHGARLTEALTQRDPCAHLSGVAGPHMRRAGVSCWLPMEKFQVMGFIDVFKALPRLWLQGQSIVKHIMQTKPDCVIFIDYPGLNLRLAQILRKRGFKGVLVHYISPTIWVWGKHRIEQMAANLDLLLLILPFEPRYFQQSSLTAKFVGHPLIDSIAKHSYSHHWRKAVQLPVEAPFIAVFPGSRPSEIQRNWPVMRRALESFCRAFPEIWVAISVIDGQARAHLSADLFILAGRVRFIPVEYTYDCMREAAVALAKSGTVTLELALHSVPTVVVYALSRLNWLIAKYIYKIKLDFYCIVNILAEKPVFPEFIDCTIDSIAVVRHLTALYTATSKRASCIATCGEIARSLQTDMTASQQGTMAILAQLSEKEDL